MKNSYFGKIFLALTLIIALGNTQAQENCHEAKLKGLFPISDYGRVGETLEMEQKGLIGSGAAIGAGVGYRYSYGITSDIALMVGGDILWNNTNSTYRDICAEYNNEAAPHYFNFPILAGISLKTRIGNLTNWNAFFAACAGLNTHYTTSTGWRNFEVRYKPAFSAALSLEVGVSFRQMSLGFEIMSLGSPTMKGSGEETHHRFKTLEKKRRMLMLNTVFSYKFQKRKTEWRPSRKTILDK